MATESGRDRAAGSSAGSGAQPVFTATSGAEVTPTVAWSRRVRRVGGLIQTAFAAFWLVRGSNAIGGTVGAFLIALSAAAAVASFAYAARVTAGTAPRPRSAEGKRIERAVTIATVLELVAAFILPVIVSAAGHSDWVLPSIAITIGPLLLYLDHLVRDSALPASRVGAHTRARDPRGNLVGHGADRHDRHRGRVLLLGTAVAGFHDLAGVRRESEQATAARLAVSASAAGAAVSEERLTSCSARVRSGAPQQASQRHWSDRPGALTQPSRRLADGIDWHAVDASDPDAATEAGGGAAVIYQCLNAPYTDWPELFPPLQQGVLSAAERNDALLVSSRTSMATAPPPANR